MSEWVENVTEDHARRRLPGVAQASGIRVWPLRHINLHGLLHYCRKEFGKMRTIMLLAVSFALSASALAQQNAFCDFDDGNQVNVQYSPNVKEQPRNGRVWAPGITLYVQTPLTLGGKTIGLGAYSVFLIPDRKNWTLIVNKNVTAGAAYNSADDVARASMDIGEIPQPVNTLQLSFGHMGPKQCSLRVYYQKTGAFTDFMEK
ncbi:MAG: hypothetical protein DMG93_00640 [Acidobacteria bacterium]|nr:MAG: hypothetical protein DMG93_00640 [Acidobacteriota bacterium]